MTLRERIERIVASQLMILATNVEWEGFWSSFMYFETSVTEKSPYGPTHSEFLSKFSASIRQVLIQ